MASLGLLQMSKQCTHTHTLSNAASLHQPTRKRISVWSLGLAVFHCMVHETMT